LTKASAPPLPDRIKEEGNPVERGDGVRRRNEHILTRRHPEVQGANPRSFISIRHD
jgi:hypothetical protein